MSDTVEQGTHANLELDECSVSEDVRDRPTQPPPSLEVVVERWPASQRAGWITALQGEAGIGYFPPKRS